MAIFKCKMCGGALDITEGMTVCECEYCGSQQTIPKLDDDRRANLYDRANHFRRNNEYDKAERIYEQILNEDNTDSEAYWSLVLCRYGIEYVEDPATHKRVPTVNRAQYTSIFDDDNYKSAIEHADTYQCTVYENEAKAINEIQKGILAISQKEEPFDVFICYKETDNSGRRTRDSVLANDLYHQLIQEGFKVFFSRITLEDKLGTAYEPYIFAALNSAKVMVVLGTKPEYFNAVWVKNEWSRYLALVNQSGGKKVLIPAYRDMDPYDLPEEFSHLQAQDMSKLGFMQDLIRGIKKIAKKDEPKAEPIVKQTVSASNNSNVNSLLKRISIFLEDGDWKSADEYCEKVLDIDPENAEAYVGKLMAELHVRRRGELKNQKKPFDNKNNFKKAVRFGDKKTKDELHGYITHINTRNKNEIYDRAAGAMKAAKSEDEYKKASGIFKEIPGWKDADKLSKECLEKAEIARKDEIYDRASNMMKAAQSEDDYKKASEIFKEIPGWKDADKLSKECLDKAEIARKDAIYTKAKQKSNQQSISSIKQAIGEFKSISGWRDVDTQIELCKKKIEDIKEKEEADRLEAERKAEEGRIAAEKAAIKKKKKRTVIGSIIVAVLIMVVATILIMTLVVIPNSKYNSAMELYESEKYEEALSVFQEINGFKNSEVSAAKDKCCYQIARGLINQGESGAKDWLDQIQDPDAFPDITDLKTFLELENNINNSVYEGLPSRKAITEFESNLEKIETLISKLDLDYKLPDSVVDLTKNISFYGEFLTYSGKYTTIFSDGSGGGYATIEVKALGLYIYGIGGGVYLKDGAKSTTSEGNSSYDRPSYKFTLLDDGRVEVIEDSSKGSTKKHYIIPEQ